MSPLHRSFLWAALPLVAGAGCLLPANTTSGPAHPGRGQPAATYRACVHKKTADRCAVTFPGVTLIGFCVADTDSKLFCRGDTSVHSRASAGT